MGDVCLFTRDEPNMTSEQTERFYKKLLTERGFKNAIEVYFICLIIQCFPQLL